jgi:hypothetical protein
MIAIAHFAAVTFYLAASAVAALPFARRVKAPVLGVVLVLLLGVGAHASALAALTRQTGAASLTGLGPALSFAGLVLAISLVVVESLAREVSLTLVAAPVAAVVTMVGNLAGLHPFLEPQGARAVWLTMHAPERPAAAAMAADKIKRHLDGARPYLADGDEDLVLALARAYADLPKPTLVPTHGDLQYRNVLLDGDGEPLLFDFERSEYNTATRDMVRLCDTWTGRPDLRAAFLDGYGRVLTPAEELRLDCEAAFDAVSGIAYGTSHDDPEVTERGHRTLRRLRAQHP